MSFTVLELRPPQKEYEFTAKLGTGEIVHVLVKDGPFFEARARHALNRMAKLYEKYPPAATPFNPPEAA